MNEDAIGVLVALIVLLMCIVLVSSASRRGKRSASTTSGGWTTGLTIGNAKTWVMMGATAVALLISWLTVGLLLAFALLCFAGFVWMKWKKVDGAGFVALIGAGFLFAWIVGPAAVEYRREQVTAVVAGQPAPTPPVTPLTAEEQAARLERERQEAEVQRVAAAAEAAAATLAEAERVRVYETLFSPAQAVPCQRRFTEREGCQTVTFGPYTYYDHYAPPGQCVRRTAHTVEVIDLGGGMWRFRTEAPAFGQFFTGTAEECGS